MPNRGDRGGSRTRSHIAAVATALFLERGFDDVTIAEIASAAGVSKVTVFAHFERKEDLLLDRLPDAIAIVRQVIRDRGDGITAVEAIRHAAQDLADRREVLSGLSEDAEPFMRTLTDSPALIARLRLFEHQIETTLAAELAADPGFGGNSTLAAALLVAAYRTVAVESIRRRLAGGDLEQLAATHRLRLDEALDAVAHGLPAGQLTAPSD